jgi:hypothetical protein
MRLSLPLPLLAVVALAGQAAAADSDPFAQLKQAVPDATIGVDARFGTATSVTAPSGRLSGAGGKGGALTEAALAAIPAADPQRTVKAFVRAYPGLFGDGALLDHAAVVARDWSNQRSGVRTVTWKQVLSGIPVQGAGFSAHLAADGALIDLASSFVPGAEARAAAALAQGVQPAIGADQAAAIAFGAPSVAAAPALSGDATQAQHLTSAAAAGEIDAALTWAVVDGQLRLAWEVVAQQRSDGQTVLTTVDAVSGALLTSRSLTRSFMSRERAQLLHYQLAAAATRQQQGASTPASQPAVAPAGTPAPPSPLNLGPEPFTLAVFAPPDPNTAGESPQPMLPGYATPQTLVGNPLAPPEPPLVTNRVTFVNPNGTHHQWIEDTVNTTLGNNVSAQPDLNDTNPVDAGGPLGSPYRVFAPPINLSFVTEPSSYTDTSVVNLFYWCNFMHDQLYDLGFTEPAGNFQQNNFGLGGVAGDRVQADAQNGYNVTINGLPDPLRRNNSDFATGVDGTPARLQAYIWDMMTPNRDADLDATVVCHEYTHGLTTRMVGPLGAQLNDLQSEGLAEGWSDFYSLSLLAPHNSDPNANYPIGAYIARYLSLTGGSDPTYQNYYQGIRRYPYSTNVAVNPLTASSMNDLNTASMGTASDNSEVHNQGEIWCDALWQARANFIARYDGGTPNGTGNQKFLQLVTDSLNLTPANPTVVQARDAILRADQNTNGGANQDILWAAFAKRGLGPAAETYSSLDTSLVQDTAVPTGLTVIGGTFYSGGVFAAVSGQSQTYSLQNISGASLDWTASANVGWLDFSATSGTLPAGATVTVTVTTNASANSLGLGSYNGVITFADLTAGANYQRAAELDVSGTYVVAPTTYQWLNPVGASTMTLTDNSFATYPMPFPFSFYGQRYGTLYVGSNGLLTFIAPTDSATAHTVYNVPMKDPAPVNALICPFWRNLDPSSAGSVTVGISGQPPYRVLVISWNGVPNNRWFDESPRNPLIRPFTFQVQLQETTNTITFEYQQVQPAVPKLMSVVSIGVENPRGLIGTQWQAPGSVSLTNLSALQFTYTVPPNAVTISIADASDGGAGQCGMGFGFPAVVIGMLIGIRRLRRRR